MESKVERRECSRFFAMPNQMIRRVLAVGAHAKGSRKRGSRAVKVNFELTAALAPEPDRSTVALDEALGAFGEIASRQAKEVELRYFGRLNEQEIAEALEICPRSVRRDWEFASGGPARELDHPPGPRR